MCGKCSAVGAGGTALSDVMPQTGIRCESGWGSFHCVFKDYIAAQQIENSFPHSYHPSKH